MVCEGGLRQKTGMLGWSGLAEFRAWLLPIPLGAADQRERLKVRITADAAFCSEHMVATCWQ